MAKRYIFMTSSWRRVSHDLAFLDLAPGLKRFSVRHFLRLQAKIPCLEDLLEELAYEVLAWPLSIEGNVTWPIVINMEIFLYHIVAYTECSKKKEPRKKTFVPKSKYHFWALNLVLIHHTTEQLQEKLERGGGGWIPPPGRKCQNGVDPGLCYIS